MAIKIYFRRFVALLLCCVLVGSAFARSAYASDPVTAASLAITGGQLAGAGLSGEAALSLAGPVGAVVGCALAACGINAYVSSEAQAAGKTRSRFVADKLVIWGAQAGYTAEQLYSKLISGISVAVDGTIQLGADTAKIIQQFGNWLVSTDGEVVEAPGAPSEDVTVSGPSAFTQIYFSQPFPVQSSGSSTGGRVEVSMQDGCFSFYSFQNTSGNVSDWSFIFASSSASYVYIKELYDASFTLSSSYTYDGKTVYYGSHRAVAVTDTIGTFIPCTRVVGSQPSTDNLQQTAWSMIYGTRTGGEVVFPHDEVFTGNPATWEANRDVLNPSVDDTPIVLNPDLLNPILDALADGKQAVMSIADYIDALQRAFDQALDDVKTGVAQLTDTVTGIQETIAIPDTAVADPSITNPSVTPNTTPILDPSAVDPGTAVTGLSFDLTQIFPFCIPFDIYDMLATLSATPEAPVYHVHYEGPYNIVIDFTVDLSPWNSVAAVLRTVELLAFCIGLAYVTRSMFIRS